MDHFSSLVLLKISVVLFIFMVELFKVARFSTFLVSTITFLRFSRALSKKLKLPLSLKDQGDTFHFFPFVVTFDFFLMFIFYHFHLSTSAYQDKKSTPFKKTTPTQKSKIKTPTYTLYYSIKLYNKIYLKRLQSIF